jgi:hypothetical protein
MRSPAGSGFEAFRVTRPSRRGTVTTLAPSAAAPRSRTNAASAWTAEGSFVFGPKGIPHTFIVSSEEARFLLVTEPAGFEQFMRAAGEPAARLEIPPPATEPPDVAALTKAAAEFGIEITGPPGIPA